MVRSASFVLLFAFASTFTTVAHGQQLPTCPVGFGDDPAFMSAGELPTAVSGIVGGTRQMEADFFFSILPILVNRTPDVVEAFESNDLHIATRTSETHRLFFQASILPNGFGGTSAGDRIPVAMQLRSEHSGLSVLSVAALSAPIDSHGNQISAINAFAQKYLGSKPEHRLAFLELGMAVLPADTLEATAIDTVPRDPNLNYFHIVERIGQLNGAGSVCSDTVGVTAEIAVRLYTLPKF